MKNPFRVLAFEDMPSDGTALTTQQLSHNTRATWLWLMVVPAVALVLAGSGAVASSVCLTAGFMSLIVLKGLTAEEGLAFRWLQTQEMPTERSKVVLKWCDACEPVRKYVAQVHVQPRKLTEVDYLALQALHDHWEQEQEAQELQAALEKLQETRPYEVPTLVS